MEALVCDLDPLIPCGFPQATKGSKTGKFMGTQAGRGNSGEGGSGPKTRPHVPSLVVSPMLEEHLFLMRSPRQVTASALDLRSFVSAAVFPR